MRCATHTASAMLARGGGKDLAAPRALLLLALTVIVVNFVRTIDSILVRSADDSNDIEFVMPANVSRR